MARPVQFEFLPVPAAALADSDSARLPKGPGVFRVFDPNGRLILLDRTTRLADRPAPSYRGAPPEGALDLREIGPRVDFCRTRSPFETVYLLYLERRRWFPGAYRRMKTFPLHPLLSIDPSQRFPRIDIAREVRPGIRYFGPFPTRREAEKMQGTLERTFRIRPCEYAIRGDDPYPDCLYFQMLTCSRPCNGDIGREAYMADIEAAARLMTEADEACLTPLQRRMEALAEETRFEEAEQVRLEIERAREAEAGALQRVFEVGRFDYLVLLGRPSRKTTRVALIRGGRILGLDDYEGHGLADSLRMTLRERAPAPEEPGRTYEEFCLAAGFLRRRMGSARFYPIGEDAGETAARVAAAVHSGWDASSSGGGPSS